MRCSAFFTAAVLAVSFSAAHAALSVLDSDAAKKIGTPSSITFGPGENNVGNCLPFGCIPEARVQQVYGSSQFSPLPFEINQITFFNRLYTRGAIDPANYTFISPIGSGILRSTKRYTQ